MEWYFFFFKQKTAYEMRISDWSSDVCSSDLIDRRCARPRVPVYSSEPLLEADEEEAPARIEGQIVEAVGVIALEERRHRIGDILDPECEAGFLDRKSDV